MYRTKPEKYWRPLLMVTFAALVGATLPKVEGLETLDFRKKVMVTGRS
jgi:UPF0716 family protein affecting phage T7 exclusion